MLSACLYIAGLLRCEHRLESGEAAHTKAALATSIMACIHVLAAYVHSTVPTQALKLCILAQMSCSGAPTFHEDSSFCLVPS